jgi:hypothetical protein
MGMGSVRPRMQGPISGGAGGGMAPQGPMRGGASWAPPSRGPMPLPPSAAPRPGQLPAPPMMPGGGNFTRPQPPAGPPMGMPPPMMGGGFAPPRGIPGGEMPGDMGMPGVPDFANRMQVQRAAGVFDKPQPMGPDPRAAALAQIQGRMGAMPNKQAMMGSIGQPPPVANSPAPGRVMPDLGGANDRMRQLLAARGGQF